MVLPDRLLRPKSIAVVGGGWWCENVIDECRKIGFEGQLLAVNPKRSEVAGIPAVPSVADLPEPPDAVFIGVNRHASVDIVRQLADIGAGGAVCFASGFSEASGELQDGEELQAALVEAAADMPVLGPNCYGFINALDGAALWPDQHGLARVDRGVAIISQSSNIALNLTMQTRGLPIAYLATVGNQAQTGLSRIGEALLADDRVTAIGLHIEGIDDLASFADFSLRAHALGKPVVALKVGRSAQAQAATISHTASLTGSMAGATALFDKLNIVRVESLAALIEALKLLHVAGQLPSANIAAMSCSGGEASLIADAAAGGRICFPPLRGEQQTALRDHLGPKVALANPLDYHTYIWGNVDAMSRTFAAMVTGAVCLGIVVLDIPRQDRCSPAEWLKTVEAVRLAGELCDKPMAVLSSLPECMPETLAAELVAGGIVPFCGMVEAMEALEAVVRLSGGGQPAAPFSPRPVDRPRTLDEHDAKDRLRPFGLRMPENRSVSTPAEAAMAAEAIGYPVVLKGTGIAHKTEAGAVVLDLRTAADVEDAACRMPAEGFLVEEMVPGALAELLIGVVRDPAHGLVLTLAAGGVLTELMEDRVSMILPVTRSDVTSALSGLRYARVLNGYRGGAPCDLEAIADAILSVQAFAMSAPVQEVEINPLLCGSDFAIAADALITCGETT